MKYTKLGNSDLNVSRICMGCMGFGDPNNGMHTWTLNEVESRKIIKAGVSGQDHIKKMVNTSLENLGLTYIDLYIYHMWDYNTPLYDILDGLNSIVEEGKVRYIGISNCFAWQLAKANALAEKEGFHKFVSVQGHYNLIFREEEREMIPYCRSENIGLTPYSSLASGRLSKMPDESSKRLKEDFYANKKYESTEEQDSVIINRVIDLSREYDVSMSEISLAWLQTKVDSPIMGATKLKHIETGVNSVELKLSEDDIKYLEEPYNAHDLVGVMADNKAKANDSEKVWVRK